MCRSICAVLQHINERVVVVNVVVHDQDSYSARCLGMDRLRQERTVSKVKPTNGLSKLQNGSQTLDSRMKFCTSCRTFRSKSAPAD